MNGPSVYWLASYPRSGNTWVRTLLHGYWHGQPDTSAQIARTVPDLHAHSFGTAGLELAATDRIVIKTHLTWSDKHPAKASTAGAIYLIRNPRDVLLSCLNFHRVMGSKMGFGEGTKPQDFAKLEPAYCRTWIRLGGDPTWQQAGFGTWEENYRTWKESCPEPVAVVRYDELRKDPGAQLRRIIEAVGETPDEDRVARALKVGSFDNMRALENREKGRSQKWNPFFGGTGSTLRAGIRFMDKGRVGGSLDAIEPGLDAAFDKRFGPILTEMGFGDAWGVS